MSEEDKDVEKAFAARLESATSKLKEKLEDAEARAQDAENRAQQEYNARIEQATEKPEKKEDSYSRAELLQMVENEQMTQLQADKLWQEQIEANVTGKILNAVNSRDNKKTVSQALNEYKTVKPELVRQGTEDREKVSEEYKYLIGIGLPDGIETELAAVRNVFGPVDKLKKKLDLETHPETGGGAPPNENKVADKLNARQRDYYQKRIDMGIYKDWDDVKEELKYSRG